MAYSRRRYRNLAQYKNLSDEDFNEIMDQKEQGIKLDVDQERRIERKIASFGEDYDLSDLKANDKLTLRALAQSYITLEDYEKWASQLRSEGISLDRMTELEKLGNIQSRLRADISKMQDDLNITRKIRKGDKEQTVISELDRLQKLAKEFYEQRMQYVYCPECKMLLFTGWFHYMDEPKNKIQLVCNRILDNGEKCNHKVVITTQELLENRGVNLQDVPEYFK